MHDLLMRPDASLSYPDLVLYAGDLGSTSNGSPRTCATTATRPASTATSPAPTPAARLGPRPSSSTAAATKVPTTSTASPPPSNTSSRQAAHPRTSLGGE